MRVITGTARGRRLVTPAGLATRPTSEMAKEAIFSIIQFELKGAMVLDLFAGSGQLGIEALSRGARGAVFVDCAKEAADAIRQNLSTTGLGQNARLMQADAIPFLRSCRDTFDIALLDPPYQQGLVEEALQLLPTRMSPGGIIICETERNEVLPTPGEGFTRRKEYRYGKAKVTTFRREEEV